MSTERGRGGKVNKQYQNAVNNIATIGSFAFFIVGSIVFILIDGEGGSPLWFEILAGIQCGLAAFLVAALVCVVIYQRGRK